MNDQISVFHILAAISAYHCSAPDYQSTDWNSILSLYDKLLLLDNSPVVQMNRAIALSRAVGLEEAIRELKKMGGSLIIELLSFVLFHPGQSDDGIRTI